MSDQEWAHIANKHNLTLNQWELLKQLMNGRPVSVVSAISDATPGVFTINPRKAYGLSLYEIRRPRLTRPILTLALTADQVIEWAKNLDLEKSA